MNEIIKSINKAADANEAAGAVEFYAYISGKEHGGALSAGSYIAMACRRILMRPGTSIGASMVVETSRGITDKAAPKFQAASAAKARALAEKNGHPPAVAEAMILTDMTLYAIPTGKGFRFCNDTEYAHLKPAEKAKAQVIKARGKILALTAGECSRYGIAEVLNQQDLAGVLGITDAQEKACFERIWRYARKGAKNARQRFRKAEQLIREVEKQRTAIAAYLAPSRFMLDREHFMTVAKMFNALAARCAALQTCAAKYPSLSESVQAADVLRKRAVAASKRIRNIYGAATYRPSGNARLRRKQKQQAKVDARLRRKEARKERFRRKLKQKQVNPLLSPGAQGRQVHEIGEDTLRHWETKMQRREDARAEARLEMEKQRVRVLTLQTLYAGLLKEFGRSP